jgi:DNA-binding response OmpR family regulator
MSEGHVLIVEDNRDIAEMVCDHLEARGFVVDYAADGLQGLSLSAKGDYDAIVLDLMLPGLSGLDVCARLGEGGRARPPVLMLTARDTLADKLTGFSHGADDYLVKPFDIEELEARLRALLRRGRHRTDSHTLSVGGLQLNLETHEVSRDGQPIAVSPIGFQILHVLMRESPRLVTRARLEMEVWGDELPDSDALRSHLYTLRKAVDRPFDRPLIHTVQSAGFRISADG